MTDNRAARKFLPLLAANQTIETPVVEPDGRDLVRADIVIIGSGMGGGTMASALATSGADVLIVERGDFLPRELENWSPQSVFADGRYKNAEDWYAADGSSFSPGVYYYVGGNTKLYGAMLPRFREADFDTIQHAEGISPAWPVGYDEIEPFYAQAERLYGVHASVGADPTEPWRSGPYPYPEVPHEPAVQQLADALTVQGLKPFSMPAAIDLRDGGRCVRCRTCDGYPCMVDAKGDADVVAVRPAVQQGKVRLLTRTRIDRLKTSPDGRTVVAAIGQVAGRGVTILGGRFVVAGGAANSAALLLRSGSDRHPNGLGNGSGLLGRNYMVHNSTFFVAVDPRRRNHTRFQKTLAWNDWYSAGPNTPHPLGNVQMLGKLQGPMLGSARPHVPQSLLRYMTNHSIDLYLTSEDLPSESNRIAVDGRGRITVHWRPNNLTAHKELVRRTTQVMRRAGYPLIFTERMGIATNSHMCGTAVMGEDPARSVLDPTCKVHDLVNVWVADSASFPSSAAVNPALTIAANALRVARKGGVVD
jgi:choline dehydrogenase-like flavoprotein